MKKEKENRINETNFCIIKYLLKNKLMRENSKYKRELKQEKYNLNGQYT